MTRAVSFPEEWGTSKPLDAKGAKLGDGLYLFGAILEDGSNLWALVFDSGHRFARISPDTDWALEERFHGDPTPEQAPGVEREWKLLLEAIIRSGRETRQEMAENPHALLAARNARIETNAQLKAHCGSPVVLHRLADGDEDLFAHAMVEAGYIPDPSTGRPFDECPFCGWAPGEAGS